MILHISVYISVYMSVYVQCEVFANLNMVHHLPRRQIEILAVSNKPIYTSK